MAGAGNPQNVQLPEGYGQFNGTLNPYSFMGPGANAMPSPTATLNPGQGGPNLAGVMPTGMQTQGDFRAAAAIGTPQTQVQTGQNAYGQAPAVQPSAAPTAASPAAGQPGQAGQPGSNVFQQAAGAYNTALQGPNIGQFMNPYTSQVINRTGMDMARQAQIAQNQLGAQATAARAFGGSRQGVAEGTMLGDYGRAFGDIAAQQRQQGFNTALGAAQQQQQMMSNLAGQGFGFGQAINQQQMQQGTMQQALMQQLIDAARGQYAGYTGAPMASLSAPLAALGAMPQAGSTTTQTQKPGLFNYLSLGLGLL